MTYKTILVSLNDIDRLDKLLETSARLAVEDGAHIIGLYVVPGPMLYPTVGPYSSPEIFDGNTRYFEEHSPQAREKFETVMRRNGLASRWIEVKPVSPEISGTVNDIGRIADLVVIANANSDPGSGTEAGFVPNVVLGVGGPVLILPRREAPTRDFSQVVCGYNRSREAARAIHDALPILKKASDVRLVWVDPSKDEEAAGALPGADMAENLARHGVKATAESMPTTGINPAAALMTRARDLGAGLLVMGAYGHSRLREFVLGGATRQVLESLTIPLMMSH
jgi:nucleotide-binding universal stress UspA family protein